MINLDDYVDWRLNEWALWFVRGEQLGVGYHYSSSFTLCQTGLSIHHNQQSTHRYLPDHEEAEEIEQYVMQLSHHKKLVADVLRKYYLGKEFTHKQQAIALGISESSFRFYLELARMWIAAKLSKQLRNINHRKT